MVTLLRARVSRIRCGQAINLAQGDVATAPSRDRQGPRIRRIDCVLK